MKKSVVIIPALVILAVMVIFAFTAGLQDEPKKIEKANKTTVQKTGDVEKKCTGSCLASQTQSSCASKCSSVKSDATCHKETECKEKHEKGKCTCNSATKDKKKE